MNYKKILLLGIIGLVFSFLIIFSASKQQVANTERQAIQVLPAKENSLQPKRFKTEAVIAGIGDILIHEEVYQDARTKNGYDFTPMFSKIKPLLQNPDLLIANQESIPGGKQLGVSGYPLFNSPYEIVDALQDAGVDFVTTANNHSLDKGEIGILNAIRYYEKKNLDHTGTFKSQKDKDRIRIVDVNGIRVAILAYAEHFNGLRPPAGKDYLISRLERNQVLSDIEKAKQDADLVVLALHWGDEYVREPNARQKRLAKDFIHHGADIILGHHPHVLQPVEFLKQKDGKQGVVIYSLGNFLSAQVWDYKNIGGMIEIAVKKEGVPGKTKTTIEKVRFHPTFTSNTRQKNYRIHPIDHAAKNGWTNENAKSIETFMRIR
jgi:poly-gamma-glutamate synthesis protein (capsule biosynthesis protein)